VERVPAGAGAEDVGEVRVSGVPERLLCAKGREFLERLELPAGARERFDVAFAMVNAIDRQLPPGRA
jgi:hypothetical protein